MFIYMNEYVGLYLLLNLIYICVYIYRFYLNLLIYINVKVLFYHISAKYKAAKTWESVQIVTMAWVTECNKQKSKFHKYCIYIYYVYL
jgi:hypothetical protein